MHNSFFDDTAYLVVVCRSGRLLVIVGHLLTPNRVVRLEYFLPVWEGEDVKSAEGISPVKVGLLPCLLKYFGKVQVRRRWRRKLW